MDAGLLGLLLFEDAVAAEDDAFPVPPTSLSLFWNILNAAAGEFLDGADEVVDFDVRLDDFWVVEVIFDSKILNF